MVRTAALILALWAQPTFDKELSDWALARAPYGVDLTPDGSIWISLNEPGARDDYAVLASDVRDEAGKPNQKVWVRGYHKRNPKVGYRETKTQYIVSCASKALSWTSYTGYNADGETVFNQRGTGYQMDPVIPGSYGSTLLKALCP